MIMPAVYMQYKCHVRGECHKADGYKYKKTFTSQAIQTIISRKYMISLKISKLFILLMFMFV